AGTVSWPYRHNLHIGPESTNFRHFGQVDQDTAFNALIYSVRLVCPAAVVHKLKNAVLHFGEQLPVCKSYLFAVYHHIALQLLGTRSQGYSHHTQQNKQSLKHRVSPRSG